VYATLRERFAARPSVERGSGPRRTDRSSSCARRGPIARAGRFERSGHRADYKEAFPACPGFPLERGIRNLLAHLKTVRPARGHACFTVRRPGRRGWLATVHGRCRGGRAPAHTANARTATSISPAAGLPLFWRPPQPRIAVAGPLTSTHAGRKHGLFFGSEEETSDPPANRRGGRSRGAPEAPFGPFPQETTVFLRAPSRRIRRLSSRVLPNHHDQGLSSSG